MIVEFTREGKTYVCVIGPSGAPPATLSIAFRPCAYKPPFLLELGYLGRDERRGIELYQPVEATCSRCGVRVIAGEAFAFGSDGGVRNLEDGLPGDMIRCGNCWDAHTDED
jgi:hypothetical protein